MPTVDVHAHLYDRDYVAELERLFERSGNDLERGAARHTARLRNLPAGMDVEERLLVMERIGLDYQVLSVSIPMSYDGDAATRLRLAQLSNDRFAEVVRQHPDHFFAFATLPLPDVDASLKELERCLDDLHMVGVCFGSNIRGLRLDHPDFSPVFEEMDRRGTTAFLHPNTPVCAGPDMEDYNLLAGLGYLFDTGVTVYRMIFSGMLERFRRLKVIVPHLGGMLPYNVGRIQGNYRRTPACQGIPRPPLDYMKELYYDTVSQHEPALRLAAEMFGAGHLLLGSDYPLGSSSLEESVRFIETAGLSAEDKRRVLGQNAVELLGLPLNVR